jgi:hypothetical protein
MFTKALLVSRFNSLRDSMRTQTFAEKKFHVSLKTLLMAYAETDAYRLMSWCLRVCPIAV